MAISLCPFFLFAQDETGEDFFAFLSLSGFFGKHFKDTPCKKISHTGSTKDISNFLDIKFKIFEPLIIEHFMFLSQSTLPFFHLFSTSVERIRYFSTLNGLNKLCKQDEKVRKIFREKEGRKTNQRPIANICNENYLFIKTAFTL